MGGVGTRFEFLPGEYSLRVYATVVNGSSKTLIDRVILMVSEEHAKALKDPDRHLLFVWAPDSAKYVPHVVERRALPPGQGDPLAALLAAIGPEPPSVR